MVQWEAFKGRRGTYIHPRGGHCAVCNCWSGEEVRTDQRRKKKEVVICEVVVEVKLSWWVFNCWREFRGGWELFPEALRFPECFAVEFLRLAGGFAMSGRVVSRRLLQELKVIQRS
jgi:hypothetical protein